MPDTYVSITGCKYANFYSIANQNVKKIRYISKNHDYMSGHKIKIINLSIEDFRMIYLNQISTESMNIMTFQHYDTE